MHVPIFTDDLVGTRPILYTIGTPESVLATYSSDRRSQQVSDEATLSAIDYIKNESLIKAIIAGHTHENRESDLTPTLKQYVTHGSFAGFVREITIL